MGGGLMQLVAYGAQDIYLTGNPQITFFKVVYRRHTNFAVESIEQTFNGQADFGKRVTATISRNGDLIQQMYLELSLPAVSVSSGTPYWTYGVGNALVKQAEIEIGGQLIDRQYGEWMDIWTELSMPAGKRSGYDDMVGNATSDVDQLGGISASSAAAKLYVPFQFWFNRNPGLALPLIALQYHEVKLNLELRNVSDLLNVVNGEAPSITGNPSLACKLYVDYVYLDTDERRRFAQVSHEYLIEQVQFTGDESVKNTETNKNVTLNFNHPVKELIWVHVTNAHGTTDIASGNKWLNFGLGSTTVQVNDTLNPLITLSPTVATANSPYNTTVSQSINTNNNDTFNTAKLQLNGHDRFSVRDATYFRKVQNLDHHTNVPRTPCITAGGVGMTASTTTVTTSTVLLTTTATVYYNPRLTIQDGGAGDTQDLLVLDNNGGNTLNVISGGGNGNTHFSSEAESVSTTVVNTKVVNNANLSQYIYTYSFALSPEEHQPSGTCNFSRIDNAILQLDYTGASGAKSLKVFAVNYNVLRIMSGMAGVAYSN